jgi:hypothetical protein
MTNVERPHSNRPIGMFGKPDKKRRAAHQRVVQLRDLEKLYWQALADKAYLEAKSILRDEEQKQLEEAKRYLKEYKDWQEHIKNRPFRDARPKRIQRLAAYSQNPEPYEGRDGTVSEAEEASKG